MEAMYDVNQISSNTNLCGTPVVIATIDDDEIPTRTQKYPETNRMNCNQMEL